MAHVTHRKYTPAQLAAIHQRLTPHFTNILEMAFGTEVIDIRKETSERFKGHNAYMYEHAGGSETMFVRIRFCSDYNFRESFTLRTQSKFSRLSDYAEINHVLRGHFTQYLYVRLDQQEEIVDWYVVNLKHLVTWLYDNGHSLREEHNYINGVWDGSSYIKIRLDDLPIGVVTQKLEAYKWMFNSIGMKHDWWT